MATAVNMVNGLLASELATSWTLIPSSDDMVTPGMLRVHLYEHAAFGGGTLMARAIVRGRAERYAYVARDYDPETRLRWDRYEGITHVKQLESYSMEGSGHTMHAVERRAKCAVPLGSDRYYLGALTHLYSKHDPPETHKVVFCSVTHPVFRCPLEAVNVSGVISACIVRQLDDKVTGSTRTRECEITLLEQVKDLAGAVGMNRVTPSFYLAAAKEQLRKRVRLYEEVVRNWDEYYGPSRDPKTTRK